MNECILDFHVRWWRSKGERNGYETNWLKMPFRTVSTPRFYCLPDKKGPMKSGSTWTIPKSLRLVHESGIFMASARCNVGGGAETERNCYRRRLPTSIEQSEQCIVLKRITNSWSNTRCKSDQRYIVAARTKSSVALNVFTIFNAFWLPLV